MAKSQPGSNLGKATITLDVAFNPNNVDQALKAFINSAQKQVTAAFTSKGINILNLASTQKDLEDLAKKLNGLTVSVGKATNEAVDSAVIFGNISNLAKGMDGLDRVFFKAVQAASGMRSALQESAIEISSIVNPMGALVRKQVALSEASARFAKSIREATGDISKTASNKLETGMQVAARRVAVASLIKTNQTRQEIDDLKNRPLPTLREPSKYRSRASIDALDLEAAKKLEEDLSRSDSNLSRIQQRINFLKKLNQSVVESTEPVAKTLFKLDRDIDRLATAKVKTSSNFISEIAKITTDAESRILQISKEIDEKGRDMRSGLIKAAESAGATIYTREAMADALSSIKAIDEEIKKSEDSLAKFRKRRLTKDEKNEKQQILNSINTLEANKKALEEQRSMGESLIQSFIDPYEGEVLSLAEEQAKIQNEALAKREELLKKSVDVEREILLQRVKAGELTQKDLEAIKEITALKIKNKEVDKKTGQLIPTTISPESAAKFTPEQLDLVKSLDLAAVKLYNEELIQKSIDRGNAILADFDSFSKLEKKINDVEAAIDSLGDPKKTSFTKEQLEAYAKLDRMILKNLGVSDRLLKTEESINARYAERIRLAEKISDFATKQAAKADLELQKQRELAALRIAEGTATNEDFATDFLAKNSKETLTTQYDINDLGKRYLEIRKAISSEVAAGNLTLAQEIELNARLNSELDQTVSKYSEIERKKTAKGSGSFSLTSSRDELDKEKLSRQLQEKALEAAAVRDRSLILEESLPPSSAVFSNTSFDIVEARENLIDFVKSQMRALIADGNTISDAAKSLGSLIKKYDRETRTQLTSAIDAAKDRISAEYVAASKERAEAILYESGNSKKLIEDLNALSEALKGASAAQISYIESKRENLVRESLGLTPTPDTEESINAEYEARLDNIKKSAEFQALSNDQQQKILSDLEKQNKLEIAFLREKLGLLTLQDAMLISASNREEGRVTNLENQKKLLEEMKAVALGSGIGEDSDALRDQRDILSGEADIIGKDLESVSSRLEQVSEAASKFRENLEDLALRSAQLRVQLESPVPDLSKPLQKNYAPSFARPRSEEGFLDIVEVKKEVKTYIDRIASYIPQSIKEGLERVKLEELDPKLDPRIAGISYGSGGRVGIRTLDNPTSGELGGEWTIRHELGHEIDKLLAEGSGARVASEITGSFQQAIVDRLMADMVAVKNKFKRYDAETSEKNLNYRVKPAEIFADLVANADDDLLAILASTTNAQEGMQKLEEYLRNWSPTLTPESPEQVEIIAAVEKAMRELDNTEKELYNLKASVDQFSKPDSNISKKEERKREIKNRNEVQVEIYSKEKSELDALEKQRKEVVESLKKQQKVLRDGLDVEIPPVQKEYSDKIRDLSSKESAKKTEIVDIRKKLGSKILTPDQKKVLQEDLKAAQEDLKRLSKELSATEAASDAYGEKIEKTKLRLLSGIKRSTTIEKELSKEIDSKKAVIKRIVDESKKLKAEYDLLTNEIDATKLEYEKAAFAYIAFSDAQADLKQKESDADFALLSKGATSKEYVDALAEVDKAKILRDQLFEDAKKALPADNNVFYNVGVGLNSPEDFALASPLDATYLQDLNKLAKLEQERDEKLAEIMELRQKRDELLGVEEGGAKLKASLGLGTVSGNLKSELDRTRIAKEEAIKQRDLQIQARDVDLPEFRSVTEFSDSIINKRMWRKYSLKDLGKKYGDEDIYKTIRSEMNKSGDGSSSTLASLSAEDQTQVTLSLAYLEQYEKERLVLLERLSAAGVIDYTVDAGTDDIADRAAFMANAEKLADKLVQDWDKIANSVSRAADAAQDRYNEASKEALDIASEMDSTSKSIKTTSEQEIKLEEEKIRLANELLEKEKELEEIKNKLVSSEFSSEEERLDALKAAAELSEQIANSTRESFKAVDISSFSGQVPEFVEAFREYQVEMLKGEMDIDGLTEEKATKITESFEEKLKEQILKSDKPVEEAIREMLESVADKISAEDAAKLEIRLTATSEKIAKSGPSLISSDGLRLNKNDQAALDEYKKSFEELEDQKKKGLITDTEYSLRLLRIKDTYSKSTEVFGNYIKSLSSGTSQIRQVGFALSDLGKQQVMFGVGLGVAFLPALNAAARYEQSIKNVTAVMGQLGSQISKQVAAKQLGQIFLELGEQTEYSANNIAGAARQLALSGFSAVDVAKSISSVVSLASAANVELSEAAEIVANITRAFGINAADSDRVVDVLTAIATRSTNTVNDLGEAQKKLAPIAAGLGQSLEATTAALGVLGSAGIRGSIAGTGLSRLFSELLEKSGPLDERLRQVGSSFAAINPEEVGLGDIIAEFERLNKIGAFSTGDIFANFDQRSARTLVTLINQGSQAFRDLEDAARSSAGGAEFVRSDKIDTLSGDFERLKSAMETAMITIGDTFKEQGRTVVQILLSMVQSFTAVVSAISPLVGVLGPFAIALGGIIISVGAVTMAIGGMIRAYAGLRIIKNVIDNKKLLGSVLSYSIQLYKLKNAALLASTSSQIADSLATTASTKAMKFQLKNLITLTFWKGLYTAATSAAAAATATLTAIMSANPLGVILVTIAIVIAGFVALKNSMDALAKTAEQKWTDSIKSKYEDLIGSLDKLASKTREAKKETEALFKLGTLSGVEFDEAFSGGITTQGLSQTTQGIKDSLELRDSIKREGIYLNDPRRIAFNIDNMFWDEENKKIMSLRQENVEEMRKLEEDLKDNNITVEEYLQKRQELLSDPTKAQSREDLGWGISLTPKGQFVWSATIFDAVGERADVQMSISAQKQALQFAETVKENQKTRETIFSAIEEGYEGIFKLIYSKEKEVEAALASRDAIQARLKNPQGLGEAQRSKLEEDLKEAEASLQNLQEQKNSLSQMSLATDELRKAQAKSLKDKGNLIKAIKNLTTAELAYAQAVAGGNAIEIANARKVLDSKNQLANAAKEAYKNSKQEAAAIKDAAESLAELFSKSKDLADKARDSLKGMRDDLAKESLSSLGKELFDIKKSYSEFFGTIDLGQVSLQKFSKNLEDLSDVELSELAAEEGIGSMDQQMILFLSQKTKILEAQKRNDAELKALEELRLDAIKRNAKDEVISITLKIEDAKRIKEESLDNEKEYNENLDKFNQLRLDSQNAFDQKVLNARKKNDEQILDSLRSSYKEMYTLLKDFESLDALDREMDKEKISKDTDAKFGTEVEIREDFKDDPSKMAERLRARQEFMDTLSTASDLKFQREKEKRDRDQELKRRKQLLDNAKFDQDQAEVLKQSRAINDLEALNQIDEMYLTEREIREKHKDDVIKADEEIYERNMALAKKKQILDKKLQEDLDKEDKDKSKQSMEDLKKQQDKALKERQDGEKKITDALIKQAQSAQDLIAIYRFMEAQEKRRYREQEKLRNKALKQEEKLRKAVSEGADQGKIIRMFSDLQATSNKYVSEGGGSAALPFMENLGKSLSPKISGSNIDTRTIGSVLASTEGSDFISGMAQKLSQVLGLGTVTVPELGEKAKSSKRGMEEEMKNRLKNPSTIIRVEQGAIVVNDATDPKKVADTVYEVLPKALENAFKGTNLRN